VAQNSRDTLECSEELAEESRLDTMSLLSRQTCE